MKYHDILDVYITASPKKIEKAYTDKLEALNSLNVAISLKEKKMAELTQAYRDCLEYRNKSFAEKCSLEMIEMGKTALEPNRANDCCSEWCTGACTCVCNGAIFITIFSIICAVVSKVLEKKRAEEAETTRIAEEEAARKRAEQLNTKIEREAAAESQCTAKRSTLNAELNHRQEQLNTQTKLFEANLKKIVTFCNNVGLEFSEEQISCFPAVAAMKQEVIVAQEEVSKANNAIHENEARIVSAKTEAENARRDLQRNRW